MKERVSTFVGKRPIIIVAPHGADDTNSDLIAEHACKFLDCFAVINRGFERSDDVDVDKDKADCNKINHCKSEVVFEEFLKPILKFKDKITQGNVQFSVQNKYLSKGLAHIFFIHGCGDIVHKEANEEVGVILGYGLGTKKDSLTCDIWRKNLFVDVYRNLSRGGDVFEGRGGGRYAGRDSNNLNQYFRKHDLDTCVQAMQLEFPFSCRNTTNKAIDAAKLLSATITDYCRYNKYELENDDPKFL
jgi:hypothetical protein